VSTRQPSPPTPAGPTNPTARRLLLVAERLFAEHGIAGVSLRQIAAGAGSANNSAVRYHFGTKDDLLRAIFELRMPELLRHRSLLRARADPDDLRARFEAYILPLLELAEAPDCSYVSFVEQLQRAGSVEIFARLPQVLASQDEFVAEMQRLLAGVPEPARSLRIRQVHALTIHVAAERERAVNRDTPRAPFGLFVSTVVDGFTAYLSAPSAPG
jgi:AcrR family transcriptional regulator